jgi:hypothetical protein
VVKKFTLLFGTWRFIILSHMNPFYILHHLISEKYKTIQSFKMHFLQHTLFVQLSLVPATKKLFETFLEAILWKLFQRLCHILNYDSSSTEAPSIQWWFQSRKQVKIRWSQVRRVRGICSVITLFAKKFLNKTDWCAGALS